MDVNRGKAIDLAVSQIERQFGKGAIMKLGEGGIIKDVSRPAPLRSTSHWESEACPGAE
jgi:hypothetical protein